MRTHNTNTNPPQQQLTNGLMTFRKGRCLIRGTSNCFAVPGHQGDYNLEPHCMQNSWSELLHPSEWQRRGRSRCQSWQTSGVEHHLRWHRHNRTGPRRVVMVEAIVDPAPDLSAGGEEWEVGYAPMQHATHPHKRHSILSYPHHLPSPSHHFLLSTWVSTLHHCPIGTLATTWSHWTMMDPPLTRSSWVYAI